MAPRPLASVVIPTLNAGPGFRETLEAVLSQEVDGDLELIIIDSGSQDGTVELCHRYPLRLLQIPPEEFGHGRTRNQAITEANGEFVALLVQDALPANPTWLSSLITPLQADPMVAGAFSRQVPRPEADYVSQWVTQYWHQQAGGRLVQQITDWDEFETLSVDQKLIRCAFNNVSSVLRRSVWEYIPLPDVAYAEDVAWALEVLRAGYRLVYEPTSVVIHSHQRSWKHTLQRAYTDGFTLAGLFHPRIPVPSPIEIERVVRLVQQECQMQTRTAEHPMSKPQAVLNAETWYHQRLTTKAVVRLLSDESPWMGTVTNPAQERRTRLDALCRFLDWQDLRPRPGRRPLPGVTTLRRIRTRLRRYLLQAVVSSDGRIQLPSSTLNDIFTAFWEWLGQDCVRWAVMESLKKKSNGRDLTEPFDLATMAEFWSFARQIARNAQENDLPLTPALAARIRCYAAATVGGKVLGRAAWSGLQIGQLHPSLSRIHSVLMQGDENWDLASLLS